MGLFHEILFGVCLMFAVIQLGECLRQARCAPNEVYKRCFDPCNTCQYRGKCSRPASKCAPGCDCRPGFFRYRGKSCIQAKLCDALARRCGADEQYYDQKPNCTNNCRSFFLLEDEDCPAGQPGCFCKDGLVKRADGKCVPFEECDALCAPDEEYQKCGTACPATCDNLGKPQVCTEQCVSGCFCKRGLVRNANNKCVKPDKCPKGEECGRDEQYYENKPLCPNTCELYPKRNIIRCAPGPPGCFCKEGLVLRKDGKCVTPNQCNQGKRKCPEKKVYRQCGLSCIPTCENPKPNFCSLRCAKPGCFCQNGLLQNKSGKCVPPRECPKKCPLKEEYKECGSLCPPTCKDPRPEICSDLCVKGCFCKDGLVRDDDGHCVPPAECPKNCPGVNEEYNPCGSACPDTCDNYGNSRICTLQCVADCFCKEGFVRDSNHRCVAPKRCPKKCIKPFEEFSKCASPCNTCENIDTTCNFLVCNEGCDCILGYTRSKNGTCIPEDTCPQRQCTGQNEEYNDCGSACPDTCDNFQEPPSCTQECIPGCFCQKGYVRDSSNKCVLPKTCPKKCPKPFEEFSDCASPCNTCDNLGKPCEFLVCNKGCDCIKGYRRNANGRCISEAKCPQTCSNPFEEFSDCASPCNTCDNLGKQCNFLVCNKGCDCIPGYRRNADGECIQVDQCPQKKCGPLSKFYECKPCTPSCSIPNPVCTADCRPGCACKPGYVYNDSGRCVSMDQCPPTILCDKPICNRAGCYVDYSAKPCPVCKCDENPGECGPLSKFYECKPCTPSCSNPNPVCTADCRPGCACKPGYVYNDSGRCVSMDQCPPRILCDKPICNRAGCYVDYSAKPCPVCKCDENPGECGPLSKFYECKPCTPSCSVPNPVCTADCRPGCACKPGYVYNDSGRCVSKDQCPPRILCDKPICNRAGCYVDYSAKPCPVCKCDKNPGECGPLSKFYECKPCTPSCSIPNPVCTADCRPGCACKPGYVYNDAGRCVSKDQCPSTCGPNSFFTPCVPCQPSCSVPDPFCGAACLPGCACFPEFVMNDRGECISKDLCPPMTPPCPLVFCKDGCYLDTIVKPCPQCVCPREPQCSIPKCGRGCYVDYTTQPCPSCTCFEEPAGPQCQVPKCDIGCFVDYDAKPCPACVCNGPGFGPMCSPPLCGGECYIDIFTKPCPSCKCPELPTRPVCQNPYCKNGCYVDYDTKPCPSCKCNVPSNGFYCDSLNCPLNCNIDYSTYPCPSCKC